MRSNCELHVTSIAPMQAVAAAAASNGLLVLRRVGGGAHGEVFLAAACDATGGSAASETHCCIKRVALAGTASWLTPLKNCHNLQV